jgi:CubicO group peptidase (beta-lactamase class C family)
MNNESITTKPIGKNHTLLEKFEVGLKDNFPACVELRAVHHGESIIHYQNPRPKISIRSNIVRSVYGLLLPFIPRLKLSTLDSLHGKWNVRSVTKSVLSALVGITIEQNILKSLDIKLGDFFNNLDKEKSAITLHQLLSMTSGFPYIDGVSPMIRLLTSKNWIQHILQIPLQSPPGKEYIYSTASSHLMAGVLNQLLNSRLLQFAQEHLFTPLGIDPPQWERDPQGILFGGTNLFLSIDDMIKFGMFYLKNGVWNHEKLLSHQWVKSSITPHSRIDDQYQYGYGWWLRYFPNSKNQGNTFVFGAYGFGGQRIYVVPQLDLVITAISMLDLWAHTEILDNLVGEYLLPAVR